MKMQARAYLTEARWCHQNYIPTVEEYIAVAHASISVPMLVMHSFVGMDDVVTKDTCEWLSSNPKILLSSSAACRYVNDIRGHKVS